MALCYQIFYILVVFVPFLNTSWTSVLPMHASHRLGTGFRGKSRTWTRKLGVAQESSPHPDVGVQMAQRHPLWTAWTGCKLFFSWHLTRLTWKCMNNFLKGFWSKLVFPSAFSEACCLVAPGHGPGLGLLFHGLRLCRHLGAPGRPSKELWAGKSIALAGPTRAGLPQTGAILYRNVNTLFILKNNKN